MATYRIDDVISCGRYGMVHRVRHSVSGVTYAMKTLPFHRQDMSRRDNHNMINTEKTNLQKMYNTPNIIRCHEVIEEDDATRFVFDYYRGGSLASLETPLDDQTVFRIARDIGGALAACHQKKIVHCDVKPENILVDDSGGFVLADFGSSQSGCTIGASFGCFGGRATPLYAAPEMFQRKEFGTSVDIWALGAMLYYLRTGQHASLSFVNNDLWKGVSCSDELRELIVSMLEKDADIRSMAF